MTARRVVGMLASAVLALGQTNTYPYYLKTFAGSFPLGDGGPAASALLNSPQAAVPDSAGNVYILDSYDLLIRKVAPNGTISTFAKIDFIGYDMKMAIDGSLYVAGEGEVIRVSPTGVESVIAGNGTAAYSGDGGLAVAAEIGSVYGIALDAAGNIYFTEEDYPGYRVREITAADGKIRTIAGTAGSGFNGDNQPATSATFNLAEGIAVDSAGGIYVADVNNYRIRKFTVGGTITTIAGTGYYGQPSAGGQATLSTLGFPAGLWVDNSNNLYLTDAAFGDVLKIGTVGTLTRLAGNNVQIFVPGPDGPATLVALFNPTNVSVDTSGILYVVEASSHRVRKLDLSGNLTTFAGRLHYGGDSGPAVSALFNLPDGVALGAQGDVFISDSGNYRIRRVLSNGTIATYAGTGVPAFPIAGVPAASSPLPAINAIASDTAGTLYLAGNVQVYRINPAGIISVFAGSGFLGDGGDGGPATSATFEQLGGIAVDSAANVYVTDYGANRVRMISASTGIISAFAGSGAVGAGGDGALATSAALNLSFPAALAVDLKGNVYVGDSGNYKVRVVNPAGIISTAAGNGSFGRLNGAINGIGATLTPISGTNALATDNAGNVYIASVDFPDIYQLSGGIIRPIATNALGDSVADGTPALGSYFFTVGLKVDTNDDVYAVDLYSDVVRKLILDSPTGFTITGGDNQTGQLGQLLANVLKVNLAGRAGGGVPGVAVKFVVASGSATLGTASTVTDSAGNAGVSLTLGGAAGPITVTATAIGAGLPSVQFTETAIAVGCLALPPVITSVNSAGDFGGGSAFASGSWLEIHGTNFAPDTRTWGSADFQGSNAPISLDGVGSKINSLAAFVYYISPTQINVQAPSDPTIGGVPITVSNCAGISPAMTMQKAAVAPGLLAPASFNVSGKQYLVALFSDGATYVGNPGLIAGVLSQPAAPGTAITAYGIGFGSVSPAINPGVVVSQSNSIPNLTIAFGTTPAIVGYAGLAPQAVGLYQFNFTVPNVPDGDYAMDFEVGGMKVPQTVYLTVHR